MTDTLDPARVHEILAILMLLLLLPTAAVAFLYLRALGAFVDELKREEPDAWQRAGSPSLHGMLMQPFLRVRQYYAFYPVLRERVRKGDERYRHAGRAYLLLKAGLAMTTALFILGATIIAWMVYHGL